jgi:hypothetical protein
MIDQEDRKVVYYFHTELQPDLDYTFYLRPPSPPPLALPSIKSDLLHSPPSMFSGSKNVTITGGTFTMSGEFNTHNHIITPKVDDGREGTS